MLDIKVSEYFKYHIDYYFNNNSCIVCILRNVPNIYDYKIDD